MSTLSPIQYPAYFYNTLPPKLPKTSNFSQNSLKSQLPRSSGALLQGLARRGHSSKTKRNKHPTVSTMVHQWSSTNVRLAPCRTFHVVCNLRNHLYLERNEFYVEDFCTSERIFSNLMWFQRAFLSKPVWASSSSHHMYSSLHAERSIISCTWHLTSGNVRGRKMHVVNLLRCSIISCTSHLTPGNVRGMKVHVVELPQCSTISHARDVACSRLAGC